MSLTRLNGNSDDSYLLQYYEQIKAGKIIAGQELITCLENLIADLENERYTYDLAAGHRRIRFLPANKEPILWQAINAGVMGTSFYRGSVFVQDRGHRLSTL